MIVEQSRTEKLGQFETHGQFADARPSVEIDDHASM
jgi:hypothetical protein